MSSLAQIGQLFHYKLIGFSNHPLTRALVSLTMITSFFNCLLSRALVSLTKITNFFNSSLTKVLISSIVY